MNVYCLTGTIGQGFCMLALAYSGCNYQSAIVFLTLATAIHGTVSSGPLASFVDISPNYASKCNNRKLLCPTMLLEDIFNTLTAPRIPYIQFNLNLNVYIIEYTWPPL